MADIAIRPRLNHRLAGLNRHIKGKKPSQNRHCVPAKRYPYEHESDSDKED
jgi:hypothetical protein